MKIFPRITPRYFSDEGKMGDFQGSCELYLIRLDFYYDLSSHFPCKEAEALADHHIITRALIAIPLL